MLLNLVNISIKDDKIKIASFKGNTKKKSALIKDPNYVPQEL